ncbi:MAG: 16S rRNA (uracil(1498)-N(3))-methyltransferase [Treponema sp.]|jgi:16S rRNA (uracil1498-N3)-methyltransferase|nr:16S rRNA (uracil(1498)-N(3))-methyltransferase [Treponema sp.]
MKQFLLSSLPGADGIVRLGENDYHYLARVRRLKAGSVLKAVLPNGEKTELSILSVSDAEILGQCKSLKDSAQKVLPGDARYPQLILFQGLPKSARMDLIVRQAAESGITVVAPFFSAYSTAKNAGEEKNRRWERIVKEARQQSGSPIPTSVRHPCSFDGILDYWKELKESQPRTAGILLHQEPLAEGTFHDYLYNDPPQVILAVGPEGGFSQEEACRFMSEGFKPLVMGSTILRTETAALYGAAVVRIILMERASWTLKQK